MRYVVKLKSARHKLNPNAEPKRMYHLTLWESALRAHVRGLIVKVKQKRLTGNTSLCLLSTPSLCSPQRFSRELGCFNWVARISRASVLHTCYRQADISRKFALARSLSHVARLLVANSINAESTSISFSLSSSFFLSLVSPFSLDEPTINERRYCREIYESTAVLLDYR